MPRLADAASALQVGRIRRPGLHAVGGVAGLLLQVSPTGSRSWILRVRVDGKRRNIGLGGFPAVSLAQAREKAASMREQVRRGVNPESERTTARRVRREAAQAAAADAARRMTFAEAARAKHAAIGPQFRNDKHRAQWISTLQTYAFPLIGGMSVADIELSHIEAVLRPIWMTKTETATRLRQRIEAVLDWAIVTGHRPDRFNPARWRGVLDVVLPRPTRNRGHHKALPWREVPGFMAALRQREGVSARALEFAILTAARSGEVRGMCWGEVQGDVWTVPAERMKAHKEHRVPLSARALDIITRQPRMPDNPHVFASPRGGVLSDMSLSTVCRRMGVEAVPHGFRSSFKDWCRVCTGYADEVSELALAHVNDDKTRSAYARDGLLAKRARLMDEWTRYCAEGASSASVTPIRQGL